MRTCGCAVVTVVGGTERAVGWAGNHGGGVVKVVATVGDGGDGGNGRGICDENVDWTNLVFGVINVKWGWVVWVQSHWLVGTWVWVWE